MVGERGVTLSGGQCQRLALARALLKDPPILVLDDSLSAVDTGTEREILDALRRRKGRQTTLIIAHRLSSVMHADRILVLDEGRLVQLGDHATLSRVDGPYRRLCEIQGSLDASIQADIAADASVRARGESHG
jgi:ABC-type multidrug transport system fused ATPase/permease subunit